VSTAILLLAGCTAGEAKDADPDSAGDSDEGGGGDPANQPVIESAEVFCYLHDTGDTYYQWAASAVASDPQGNNTIETLGTLDVLNAGAVVGTTSLVCVDGSCSTSWREGQLPASCLDIEAYRFAFTVTDIDGHESETVEVSGTKTEGP
jgi:hypothetical protein